MQTEMEAIIVMYWLVADMTVGSILQLKKSGPSTIPPAIPVSPHRTAAIRHTNASHAMSAVLLNLMSLSSNLQPSLCLISWMYWTVEIECFVNNAVSTQKLKIKMLLPSRENICSLNKSQVTKRAANEIKVKNILLLVKWCDSSQIICLSSGVSAWIGTSSSLMAV